MNTVSSSTYQNQLTIFRFNISIRFLNLVLWSLAAALLITYLAVTTHAGALGYSLKVLERQVTVSENDTKNLEAVTLAGQSLEKVALSAQTMGFVPVSKIDYINFGLNQVAQR